MKSLILALACLALAGCDPTGKIVKPTHTTDIVLVPVVTIANIKYERPPLVKLAPEADDATVIKTLRANLQTVVTYVFELESYINSVNSAVDKAKVEAAKVTPPK
jgi:uncharacterized protein YcfL